ncbi:MAG: hypothetical protein HY731_00565 [Candidatus Tectomicrobia bacterium]|nr:hypothetical protein [Candidatus Tectomicrobia bacterium]
MLYIKTDLSDTRWLAYLLEEFRRINDARFDIRIAPLTETVASPHVLHYTGGFVPGKTLVNRSDILPEGQIVWVSRDIYILRNTDTDNDQFLCRYDIFWNAFVFLSRMEEFLSELRGCKIKSYSFNHPRHDRSTFHVPVVNHLFNELERMIKTHFPDLQFLRGKGAVLDLSHDLDYIEKTVPLRIKRIFLTLRNAFKTAKTPVRFLKESASVWKFFRSSPSYWYFDYWEELEKRNGHRSVFYIYARTDAVKGPRVWLIDPSYDIRKNSLLQERLRQLLREGFEVGLHGSFSSAVDEDLLRKEKEIVEEMTGVAITKVRQHWLCYEERTTPFLHEKLFEYDSTLGWNDRMGFRAGCASRYRPYDHLHQRAFNFFETPQVVMDANIYDYGVQDVHTQFLQAMEMICGLENCKNSHISISWHPHTCANDYGWDGPYWDIIRAVRRK